MAPKKTKRLSSFDDPAQAAIKRAFSAAKNKPRTSLSNPLLIDDSELPPQNPNPPVPLHNPKPVVDRPIRDRVRTFHGARPKITKKRRKFDSQEPENSLPELPVPELPAPEPDPELPAPHPMPAALRTSPRRAPTQPSRHPVAAAVRSSPRRAPPQPSS